MRAGLGGNLENSCYALGVGVRDMMSQPILIAAGGTLEYQPIEDEISNTPFLLSGTNSGLLHRLSKNSK